MNIQFYWNRRTKISLFCARKKGIVVFCIEWIGLRLALNLIIYEFKSPFGSLRSKIGSVSCENWYLYSN